jgi:hypothetical protein
VSPLGRELQQLTKRGWPSKNSVRSVKESLSDSERTGKIFDRSRQVLECFALRETASVSGLLKSAKFWILDSSVLRPVQCILPTMFQIGGFMPRD